MACDCLADMNKLLAEHNTRLPETIFFGQDDQPGYVTPTLLIEKIQPRNRLRVNAVATFCPFCGMRYRPEAKTAADASHPTEHPLAVRLMVPIHQEPQL